MNDKIVNKRTSQTLTALDMAEELSYGMDSSIYLYNVKDGLDERINDVLNFIYGMVHIGLCLGSRPSEVTLPMTTFGLIHYNDDGTINICENFEESVKFIKDRLNELGYEVYIPPLKEQETTDEDLIVRISWRNKWCRLMKLS